jgi:cytochrome P450
MRQRKLLLPPFQGSAVRAFREMIREVAEEEVAGWKVGTEFRMRDRMRALTFEVICRAVFGVTERERIERLRATPLPIMDAGGATARS